MSSLAEVLLSPRAVAIVGQSDDADKPAGRPLKFLRQAGFAGRVYPVNPRRQEVLGERAWPSLAALPELPDHAYIVAPTEAAILAVEECGRAGVKIATVLADGFAEMGAQGLAREARLRAICAATGIRIVGPSSLGVVDLRSRAMLTANAVFDEPDWPAGRIFAASHSGTMIGALASRGRARNLGFAGLVSVGNEIDLSLGEICEATLDDPGIDGYMLFLETMRHAQALRRFALAAAERGKPVIAYKLGRSDAARELAVSHTGALAGEDDVAEAYLSACGIARVNTLEGLLEGAVLLGRMGAPARVPMRRNVGVVTTTAGGATMVVDPLATRGINIEGASPATLARLAQAGIEVKPARITDLTLAGARYDIMKAALDTLLAAPEFDLVLAVIGSSARHYPQQTVRPLIEAAGAGKPLAAFLVPDAPEALAALSRAGVPNFRTPEACADALAAALARRMPLPSPACGGGLGWGTNVRDEPASGPVLDEVASGALIERLGIARAPAVVLDADITQAPALPFPYPVAVKILSPGIAHKTDIGGVVLAVADAASLLAAIRTIRAAVATKRSGAIAQRVLVQPMVSGMEVLVGYRVDRDVGPLIMLAAGGVLTEIARDRTLRLAPIELAAAHEMIAQLRSIVALRGYRGGAKGDLDALARALVAFSQLASDPAVLEAEINPLMVLPQGQGVIAVDALVKLAAKA